jgi:high-affinity iron transporter
MRFRPILGAAGLIAAALIAQPRALAAQEPPAKRLSAIVGVAVEEYSKGVDANGKLIAASELDEVTDFLKDAQDVASHLTSANAPAVRLVLDSLMAASGRRVTPAELAKIHDKFVVALGVEGALDLPTRGIDLAAGKAIFEQNCAQCHGPRGAGDGPLAKNIHPAPEAIGSAATMNGVSPALVYRVISVGVAGTPMPAWSTALTPDQRWAVASYVNSLRASDADRAAGKAMLKSHCADCSGASPPELVRFEWQAEHSDSQLVAAITSGDAATGFRDGARVTAVEAKQIVAALRASPVVAAPANTLAGDAFSPSDAARHVVRLVDDALTAARGSRQADAGDLAFDAYIAFEPLEGPARMRNPGLVADMERHFADFKGALKAGDLAAAEAVRAKIEQGMPAILELSTPVSTTWGVFFESFVIILREGFEAILVLGAIVAFLIKTGNRARLRDIWLGSGVGIAASAILAVALSTILKHVPASQDTIEGVTMLIAVIVLFSVSYWLLSKVEAAKWQKFIRDKVSAALSNGGMFALAFVAFLAVFREGAETALFYQALFTRGGDVVMPVSFGLLSGSATLAVIFTLFWRFGLRIPLRPFFAVTSALLYYMALVFAGTGIKELQEANVLPRTMIPGFPHVDLIGLYPTVETLMAQGVLLVLLLFALWTHFKPSPADEAEEASVPPEVAARLAELQATAIRLQDRVSSLEKEIESETKPR